MFLLRSRFRLRGLRRILGELNIGDVVALFGQERNGLSDGYVLLPVLNLNIG